MSDSRNSEQANTSSSSSSSDQKRLLTIGESLVAGSAAGAAEVTVDHPLWSIKTRMQSRPPLPFTLNPVELYRGIVPNAASMVPITAVQLGLNSCYQHVFSKAGETLSNMQKIIGAFLAGVGSALIACPVEMVMTHQSKMRCSFYMSAEHILTHGRLLGLYTGLTATALRDGGFTGFFLGVTPIISASLKPYCPNDYVAYLGAGMVAGVSATLATQGMDTIKTVQQSSDVSHALNLKNTVKMLYGAGGVSGFFKGAIPRGTRVMSAITIMNVVTEKAEDMLRTRHSL